MFNANQYKDFVHYNILPPTMSYIDTDFNDETSVEFKARQKRTASAIKRFDKYYEDIYIPIENDEILTVQVYGSGSIGSRIRNAVTGITENVLVGSSNEDSFFKVTDSTARYGRQHPLILYYDSPEQFENHYFTTLDNSIRTQWHKKQNAKARRPVQS